MISLFTRGTFRKSSLIRTFANAIPEVTKYNVLTIPSLRSNYSMFILLY